MNENNFFLYQYFSKLISFAKYQNESATGIHVLGYIWQN